MNSPFSESSSIVLEPSRTARNPKVAWRAAILSARTNIAWSWSDNDRNHLLTSTRSCDGRRPGGRSNVVIGASTAAARTVFLSAGTNSSGVICRRLPQQGELKRAVRQRTLPPIALGDRRGARRGRRYDHETTSAKGIWTSPSAAPARAPQARRADPSAPRAVNVRAHVVSLRMLSCKRLYTRSVTRQAARTAHPRAGMPSLASAAERRALGIGRRPALCRGRAPR